MTTLTIQITKEVLEATKACTNTNDSIHYNCAIAHAVRDVFPNARVRRFDIEPFRSDIENTIELPENAIKFICQFDHSTPEDRIHMNPISFEIEISDEVIDLMEFPQIEALNKIKAHESKQRFNKQILNA